MLVATLTRAKTCAPVEGAVYLDWSATVSGRQLQMQAVTLALQSTTGLLLLVWLGKSGTLRVVCTGEPPVATFANSTSTVIEG